MVGWDPTTEVADGREAAGRERDPLTDEEAAEELARAWWAAQTGYTLIVPGNPTWDELDHRIRSTLIDIAAETLASTADATADEGRPFSELSGSGLLWLINRVVFHPRGYALALHADEDGTITGWSLLGDGSEPWTFTNDEDDHFTRAEQTLRDA